MKRTILTLPAFALAVTAFAQLPAPAHAMTLEEKDALFLACVAARGYTDAATVICYNAAYGSETSGGGAPNQINTPVPVTDCRGREFECSFGRPN
jgi:hypothetical protein